MIVTAQQAKEFAARWQYKGVMFINLDDAHLAFAVDFANAVIEQLVRTQQRQQPAKVVLTD